jgi:hypothetical protein
MLFTSPKSVLLTSRKTPDHQTRILTNRKSENALDPRRATPHDFHGQKRSSTPPDYWNSLPIPVARRDRTPFLAMKTTLTLLELRIRVWWSGRKTDGIELSWIRWTWKTDSFDVHTAWSSALWVNGTSGSGDSINLISVLCCLDAHLTITIWLCG